MAAPLAALVCESHSAVVADGCDLRWDSAVSVVRVVKDGSGERI